MFIPTHYGFRLGRDLIPVTGMGGKWVGIRDFCGRYRTHSSSRVFPTLLLLFFLFSCLFSTVCTREYTRFSDHGRRIADDVDGSTPGREGGRVGTPDDTLTRTSVGVGREEDRPRLRVTREGLGPSGPDRRQLNDSPTDSFG